MPIRLLPFLLVAFFPVVDLRTAEAQSSSAAPDNSVSAADEPTPFGLHTRPIWAGSNIKSYPDGEPAYRVVRRFSQLNLERAIGAWQLPGTPKVLVAQHLSDWGGPTRIYSIDEQGDGSHPSTFIELPEIVYGLAFHPEFATNRQLFIGCNGRSESLDAIATKVLAVKVSEQAPFEARMETLRLVIEWPSNGHNGGDLCFDERSMLFVTAGDGTSDSDTLHNGQDLSTIPGSVIRIDVEPVLSGEAYRVPVDNPFANLKEARPEIWAYGLRNPWRISYDPESKQLWVGNNGQDLEESVHLIEERGNYGWSVMEGSRPFQLERERGLMPITPPTVSHDHSEARSLTGGHVYRGTQLPELQGAYVYGDYATGSIWAVRYEEGEVVWSDKLARTSLQITDFMVDSNGELLVVDHGGGLYRLEKNPLAGGAGIPFPSRLSETGLFSSTADHQVADGVISYSVNSPLWSDGSLKSRYFAIPGEEVLNFHPTNSFGFPNDSVLIKTFSLPIVDKRTPISDLSPIRFPVRRVETRLLVKQEGEWYGYSYRWNDDETDATLVGDEGETVTFEIAERASRMDANENPDAEEEPLVSFQLDWRFPSRSECAVCHTRAANFVLGLNVPQLNRDHTYPVAADNQLRTMFHIGLFDRKEAPQGDLDRLDRYVDPMDESAELEQRARAYLASNCANCHQHAGGGNSSIDLRASIARENMKLIDVVPTHDKFEIEEARLIAPAAPESSVLLHRIANRGRGQMPPLSSNRVDREGVELIRAWIESMTAAEFEPSDSEANEAEDSK